jgi:hypothetical protein
MLMCGLLVPALGVALAACSGEPGAPPGDPDVEIVQLMVGSRSYRFNVVTHKVEGTMEERSAPLLPGDTAVQISGRFLAPGGELDAVANSSRFQLEVAPLDSTQVSFTRTGPFSGTLKMLRVQSQIVDIDIFLVEKATGHEVFRFDMPIVRY